MHNHSSRHTSNVTSHFDLLPSGRQMSPSSLPLASERKQSAFKIIQKQQLDHNLHHRNSCNQNHHLVELEEQAQANNNQNQHHRHLHYHQQQAQHHHQQLQVQNYRQQPMSIHMHSPCCHLSVSTASPPAPPPVVSGAYGAPEAAANAMVVVVRLILVIFIGVLLVKLRFNSKDKLRKQARRREQALGQLDSQQQQQQQSVDSIESSEQSSRDEQSNTQDQRSERLRRLSGHQLQQVEKLRRASKLKTLPGPTGLPVVGYLPFLEPRIHLTLTQLSEKYGSIYQVFLGGIRVIVLNDAALIREAFKQPVFSGRPDTQLAGILQGYGIINSDGALWREQRLFLHQAFRKLGAKSLMSGDNGLEAKIQCQVDELVEDLEPFGKSGQPFQVKPYVARAISSVVGSILMNLTYRKEKEKFDRLIHMIQEGFRLFSIAMPIDFIPILGYLPVVSKAFNKIKELRNETCAFLQDFADEHRRYLTENYNVSFEPDSNGQLLHPNQVESNQHQQHQQQQQQQQQQQKQQLADLGGKSRDSETDSINGEAKQPNFEEFITKLEAIKSDDPTTGAAPVDSKGAEKPAVNLDNIVARNLVEAYILQQKKHANNGKESYFSDKQLVQIMADIFSAGLETVTSAIEWAILFLILNPDVQEKVQREVDTVIGRDRKPKLDDLSQMPYTEATIYEIIRRSSVVTLGISHSATEDAQLGGYLIPKGAQLIPNFYGIHMSKDLWEEPERFMPERFIVNGKAHKPSHFIPFSVGRRTCLGDLLAKMEIFLFISGMMQKYTLLVPEKDLKQPPSLDSQPGLSNAPLAYCIQVRIRT